MKGLVFAITVDTAPDLFTLGLYANRFGDDQVTIAVYLDVTVERLDVFCREDGHRNERQREGGQQPKRYHPGCDSSNSKYSAGSKPNRRASNRSGKLSIRVFRSLTAPL